MKKLFDENGYIKIQAAEFNLSIDELANKLLAEIKQMKIKSLPAIEDYNLADFIDKLHRVDLENESDLLSQVYQLLPTLPSIWRFASNEKLIDILTETLGVKSVSLGTVPLIRLDRSHNNLFSTPWHQDYWFSQSSPDSVVVWFPLTKMVKEIGFLSVIPNPASYGILEFKDHDKGRSFFFEPVESIDETKSITLDCNFGDILIFKQSLLHRSGLNNSGRTRVSCQLRYNDMYRQDFGFSTFTAINSNFVKDRQGRK